MDRKSRAARTSLVAAFLAAGGSVVSTAPAQAAPPPGPTVSPAASQLQWGDQLVRFLKLEGFPAYLKVDNFAQYYKFLDAARPQLDSFYKDNQGTVDDLLALYHKANAGPLTGILIGLEQYYKNDNREPLLDYLKTPGAMDAYLKFEDFINALGKAAPDAFQFFYKETGIEGVPSDEWTDGPIL